MYMPPRGVVKGVSKLYDYNRHFLGTGSVGSARALCFPQAAICASTLAVAQRRSQIALKKGRGSLAVIASGTPDCAWAQTAEATAQADRKAVE